MSIEHLVPAKDTSPNTLLMSHYKQLLIVFFVIAVVLADEESPLEEIVVDVTQQIVEQHPDSDIPAKSPVGSKENDEIIVKEDSSHNPKLLASCHWGTVGCNKGKWSDSSDGDVNSSFIDNNVHSGLAGSAMAKIEARVMKSLLKQSVSSIDDGELSDREDSRSGSNHQPPQGFRLAGRVVTNPVDGLSYFLDPQKEDNNSNNDLMMTIPYRYLECGPTIESTTEAFSLSNMVLRHLPKHDQLTHWMNSRGGVTVENVVGGVEGEERSTKYFDIDGNSDGHPKLLVALSPIEITVSGNNEESRLFYQGDVILMEDTIGKGHKMNSVAPLDKSQHSKEPGLQQHGQDVYVIMITLPHTVHLPVYDWLEEASSIQNLSSTTLSAATAANGSNNIDRTIDSEETDQDMTKKLETMRTLSGFSSKHHKYRRFKIKRSSLTSELQQPCPLEYDSAYASLFIPTHHNQHNRIRINRRVGGGVRHNTIKDSVFDDTNPSPPWFYTHAKESILARYLPSLRRTMLISIGLSLTSSFVYCVQLLYPPLLALWGGATVILGGALLNVLVTRWSYRRYIADWLEEWRWRREVRRNNMHRNGIRKIHETVDNDEVSANNGESIEQSDGGCSDCAID